MGAEAAAAITATYGTGMFLGGLAVGAASLIWDGFEQNGKTVGFEGVTWPLGVFEKGLEKGAESASKWLHKIGNVTAVASLAIDFKDGEPQMKCFEGSQ